MHFFSNCYKDMVYGKKRQLVFLSWKVVGRISFFLHTHTHLGERNFFIFSCKRVSREKNFY